MTHHPPDNQAPDPAVALDVLHTIAPGPARRWPTLALAIAVVMLALALAWSANELRDSQDRIASNSDAIRTSCALLSNAIVQSGAGSSSAGRGPAAPAPPQQQLTALYISVIMRQMNASERRHVAKLANEVAAAGGEVEVPNCAQVVKHPDNVQLISSP